MTDPFPPRGTGPVRRATATLLCALLVATASACSSDDDAPATHVEESVSAGPTEESTTTLPLPAPVPTNASEVTFTVHMTTGFGPPKPVTLPVQAP